MIAAPPIVPQNARLDSIKLRQAGNLPHPFVDFGYVGPPITVAAPGIEAAVVAGLLDRVKYIAPFDNVPAPASVANVDARARHVVNRAVSDGDVLGEVDLDAGGLLFHASGEMD